MKIRFLELYVGFSNYKICFEIKFQDKVSRFIYFRGSTTVWEEAAPPLTPSEEEVRALLLLWSEGKPVHVSTIANARRCPRPVRWGKSCILVPSMVEVVTLSIERDLVLFLRMNPTMRLR
ncbi:hypothetical protein VIGAN_04215300 [Vigna angularis var. angularis]|uniref:Uncharacterized protein n=1 Tax=Vigna angularis var. angularis TaxID=157739 RepID=A0A0S3RVZ3_PHAAN|nr:hypothetical protein VIGAN_04215300 [Vigna angularis var. angularis]